MSNKSKMVTLALILFMQAWATVSVAEVIVQATVDRNELGKEDTLIAKVEVISEERVEVGEPRLPDLSGFDLINSWTGRSQGTELIHGPGGMEYKTTAKVEFNYILAPKKTGELELGAFEVVVDGKSFRTKPITVAVNEASAGGTQVAESDEDEDLFNQLLRRGAMGGRSGFTSPPPDPKHAFFIQVELDKTEVYEGEQVTANWYIYTRGVIEQLDRLKFPNLKGFWKEDIEVAPSLNFRQEIVNGVPYKKALLASYALFPINPGKAVVDEYKIKSVIRLPSSGFGSFGFGRPYTYTRSSENVSITVNPLPTEGKPADFSGAVGEFSVNGQVEGERFKVNQPFSYRIRFEGAGNAKLIDLPSLDLPPSLELYDVKKQAQFYKSGRSYKEFELLLIPREAGDITIPPLTVSIFDPAEKSYVSRSTQPFDLTVEPAGTGDSIAPNRLSKAQGPEEVEVQGLPGPIVDWRQGEAGQSLPLAETTGFALLALFGALGWKARREFEWGVKKRSLRVEVKQRFKKVYSLIDQGKWRPASVEVTNIIYHTFGEVAGGAGLEMEKLILKAPPSVRRSLEPELSKQVEYFQALSFAPEEVLGDLKEKSKLQKSAQKMEKLLLKAAALIDEKEEGSVSA